MAMVPVKHRVGDGAWQAINKEFLMWRTGCQGTGLISSPGFLTWGMWDRPVFSGVRVRICHLECAGATHAAGSQPSPG